MRRPPPAPNASCAPQTLWIESAHGLLAQLVERLVYTENVGGSSPSRPTIPPSRPMLARPVRVCRVRVPSSRQVYAARAELTILKRG